MKRVTLTNEELNALRDIVSDIQVELDIGGQKKAAAAYEGLLDKLENAEDVS